MPRADDVVRRHAQHRRAVEHDARRSAGWQKREMQLNTVDLPAPFGPISAWIEPSRDVHREVVDARAGRRSAREVLDRRSALMAPTPDAGVEAAAVGSRDGSPAPAAIRQAPDAARHEHHGEDEDQAVDELLPDQQAARRGAQHLGQQADQRARRSATPGIEPSRRPPPSSAPARAGAKPNDVRVHERLEERVHAAGDAGVARPRSRRPRPWCACTSMPEAAATCSLSRIAHIARPSFERVRYIVAASTSARMIAITGNAVGRCRRVAEDARRGDAQPVGAAGHACPRC